MGYFADLTHYEYFPKHPDNYLNVGWLSAEHPFPTGSAVSDGFLHNLELLCKETVNICMGFHDCEFCRIPDAIIGTDEEHTYRWERKLLGNGEIHVPGEEGNIYVAPELIYHYVKEHRYQPPAEFILAVESVPEKRLRWLRFRSRFRR